MEEALRLIHRHMRPNVNILISDEVDGEEEGCLARAIWPGPAWLSDL